MPKVAMLEDTPHWNLVPQQHKHGWLGRFSSAGPAGLSDCKEEMVR